MSRIKINCEDCYEEIYLFIDRELSDQDYKLFEDHLIECESCQQVLNEAQSFEQELRDFNLDAIIPPENGWEKFQLKISDDDSLDLDISLPTYTVMDNILSNIKRNYVTYGLLMTASFSFFMLQDSSEVSEDPSIETIVVAKA